MYSQDRYDISFLSDLTIVDSGLAFTAIQYLEKYKIPVIWFLTPYTLYYTRHCTDISDLVCTDNKISFHFQKGKVFLEIAGERSVY